MWALWYSGYRPQLRHRRSRFDNHSRRFTWQVNEPSPGLTHALLGKLGSQFKALTGYLQCIYNCENGLLSSCNSAIYKKSKLFIHYIQSVFRHYLIVARKINVSDAKVNNLPDSKSIEQSSLDTWQNNRSVQYITLNITQGEMGGNNKPFVIGDGKTKSGI